MTQWLHAHRMVNACGYAYGYKIVRNTKRSGKVTRSYVSNELYDKKQDAEQGIIDFMLREQSQLSKSIDGARQSIW